MLDNTEKIIAKKFEQIAPYLNEKALRIWVATEAEALSRGGISLLSKITGISRSTIHIGLKELHNDKEQQREKRNNYCRKEGGGRKKITEKDSTLQTALEELIDGETRGDPEHPLKWTCKSTPRLANELNKMGYKISQRTVYNLLVEMNYSMQSNRKTKEGTSNPDRDAQFHYIAGKVKDFQSRNQPVISVDTKKKELIGEFKNNGREWHKVGQPIQTSTYDFPDKSFGKVAPYGIYDITRNDGWVSVGISHDTAEFAVASIRSWWLEMGKEVYPHAKELLITADCGGSNGYRVGLWKKKLSDLAKELGMGISVCHFPPGTSKWNKIEHRMFCYITQNWRGRPLISREVVVNLIGSTTTQAGLAIRAKIDDHQYEKGVKVPKKELRALHILKDSFHGEWNYKIPGNVT